MPFYLRGQTVTVEGFGLSGVTLTVAEPKGRDHFQLAFPNGNIVPGFYHHRLLRAA